MAKYRRSFIDEDEELEELETQRDTEKEIREIEEKKEGDPAREDWKKRYSDVRRHMEEMRQKHNEELSQLKQQVAELSTKGLRLPKTEDEMNEWAERNPDAAGILETLVQKRIQESKSADDERITRLEAREAEMRRRDGIESIKRIHPDFDELKTDNDFAKWLADCETDPNRSHHHYALMKGNDPRLAIDAITIFKQEMGKTKKEEPSNTKKKRKDESAADAVNSRSAPKKLSSNTDWDFSESQIQKMNAHEFDSNEEAIMEAHRQGRIYMDLTGAAQ